jgi:hypothetical protein
MMQKKQLNNLADILNEERRKLAFIGDIFSQDDLHNFRFSDDGMAGFFFILRGIETMIEHVANELPHAKEVK